MVVPIYKKWEANLARIQIVRQEKVTQLLAFFADFHHGTCMNFVLKGTDHIESFGRSGKFGIRIVDAKFALPKRDDDPASDFVCLDMPEYPIEHDDIAITFDTEAGAFHLIFFFFFFFGDMPANNVQTAPVSRWPCLDRCENRPEWDLCADNHIFSLASSLYIFISSMLMPMPILIFILILIPIFIIFISPNFIQ